MKFKADFTTYKHYVSNNLTNVMKVMKASGNRKGLILAQKIEECINKLTMQDGHLQFPKLDMLSP